jgi:hypothetical protein
MKITIDKAVLEHVRAWIAERPEDRTESAGKIVAMLTRALAQPAAQPTNCRHCGGPETVLCGGQCKPAAQPKKRETWLAIREGHLNAASDSYFTARPQLDSAVNRRIFYAGHSSGYGDEAPQPAAQQTERAGEPVAWAVYWGVGSMRRHSVHFEIETAKQASSEIKSNPSEIRPLYTRPAVPLSDEQIKALLVDKGYRSTDDHRMKNHAEWEWSRRIGIARAIEAAHKIGGAE